MPGLTEEQINNIYLRCNSVPMGQLLEFCLDTKSGINIKGLKAVNYNKIDQLEKMYNAQMEDSIWEQSQNSIDMLTDFIEKCQGGEFSQLHLAQAIDRRRTLAEQMEESDWKTVKSSNNLDDLNSFIKKCTNGTYSEVHLQDAKNAAELVDWNQSRASCNPAVMNSFIQKCNMGIYSSKFIEEAKKLLETWENGTIVKEWSNIQIIQDDGEKLRNLNLFIQKYGNNPTETAQKYIGKANGLVEAIRIDKEARTEWIDAKDTNTILAYSSFINKFPHCKYREEADEKIAELKGDLLNDMKRYPFKYKREDMYSYISTGALTWDDLVEKSFVLTDKGYSHIKQYPTLQSEQRLLPVSKLENPHSEEGNTDVYFFGVSGSGKTCVLAGLMSLAGQLGFRFDPKGPGGGGNYAMELQNYARTSMLPPATDQSYIQVIDAQINDEDGNLHPISFIEMSGEKTALFAAMDNPSKLDDLGPGAAGLLSNDNNKVLFFVIDPTNDKNVEMGMGSQQWVRQSNVLDCITSLLSKDPSLMKKVLAIHIILTKSDTLGDYADQSVIKALLKEQGYQVVLMSIKELCQKYDINKQVGFEVGLFPFCVGKFMPGDVYTFDETDSLKVLRVIQKNTGGIRPNKGFCSKLKDWFNS